MTHPNRSRPPWGRRIAVALLALVIIAAGALLLTQVVLVDDSRTVDVSPAGPFYKDPTPIPTGKPGLILRTQPQAVAATTGAPAGTTLQKILYLSTDQRTGKRVPVSGQIWTPPGPAPRGGRPVLAWAHGTSGIASQCAPSLVTKPKPPTQPGFSEFLRNGWVVVATDYRGLGTQGPLQYLIGAASGRNVLDSVRAARNIPAAHASNRVVVWGHSQGGQSALFAGQLAPSYAPELKLLGVAAAAPAAELGQILRDDYNELDGAIVASLALWSWSHTQPGANLADVATPDARDLIDSLASRCINTDSGLFEDLPAGAEEKLTTAIDPRKLEAQPAWARIERENTPATSKTGPPLLIAQGTADNIIHPQTTATLVAGFCKAGRKVESIALPGVGHPTAGLVAAPRVASWAAARFAGQPAPSNC